MAAKATHPTTPSATAEADAASPVSRDVASPEPADVASCPVCGGLVPDRTGLPGRRAAWCSKGCRQAAWRSRRNAAQAAEAARQVAEQLPAARRDLDNIDGALQAALDCMPDAADPGVAAPMSGWESDVAGWARRLAAAATRLAELADAHTSHVADHRRAAAVIRRPPVSRGRDDESPAAPPAGIVATKPATALSASGISQTLARLGFARAAKVPGGRGGVLSPITEGFKVWGRGSPVVVDHLPADAEDRRERLTAMAAALTAAGYTVTPASDRGDLHVTIPPGPGGIVAPTAAEASETNHSAVPAPR